MRPDARHGPDRRRRRPQRETAPLWNDKRTAGLVASFEADNDPADYLRRTGNPATPAWPAFKLQWIRDQTARLRCAAAVLMPKDYVNYRLTDAVVMDRTEAVCSFMMDPETGRWSAAMAERLGLDLAKLPPIREPAEIVGHVTAGAAAETGLLKGTPVLVGGGDYPLALLGSGVCSPGIESRSSAPPASSR